MLFSQINNQGTIPSNKQEVVQVRNHNNLGKLNDEKLTRFNTKEIIPSKSPNLNQLPNLNLTRLNNHDLDLKIKSLAHTERKLLSTVISHIKEAEARKLYFDYGYPNLFEYLVKACGYPGGSAQRRIDAARLLAIEPKLSSKIESGEINLAQTTILQRAIREKNKTNKVTLEQKRKLIEKISDKSSAETQILISKELDIQLKEKPKETHQKDESVRLEITLTKEQWQKLQKARDLASNATQSKDWSVLLEYLSDKLIKQKEGSGLVVSNNERTGSEVNKRKSSEALVNGREGIQSNKKAIQQSVFVDATVVSGKGNQRKNHSDATMAVAEPIPQKIRKSILRRDQCCQYKDPRTHQLCGSRWNLHIDHIQPKWAGGTDCKENLRILCQKHNHHVYRQQAGIKVLAKTIPNGSIL